ncbi:hypothetical protein ACWEJ6_48430 [Nonomuraea sp. NPDC004702]
MLGIIGLAIAFIALCLPALALAFFMPVAGLTVVILGFGREIQDAILKWSRFEFVETKASPIAKARPHDKKQNVQVLDIVDRGSILLDNEASELLLTTPVHIHMASHPYKLPRHLRLTAPQAFRLVSRASIVFNGALLSLAGDISSIDTELRITHYFDGICSNELCRFKQIDRMTGQEVDIRERETVDPQTGQLLSFSRSKLSNHIGVSTIAFTEDGQLVVCQQTAHNLINRVFLAPSGSGTIPPSDYRPGDTLQELIIRAMERELCEEVGVLKEDIQSTELVSYGRWLERGAKPEFYGMTRLRISSQELKSRSVQRRERLYTARTRVFDVDLGGIGRSIRAGTPIVGSVSCHEDIRNSGSMSLLVALHSAALSIASPT